MPDTLRHMVDQAHRVVFFGGAGVSTESGIPDFRSANGLYAQKSEIPPEVIISHGFFYNHPDAFFRFYREKMLFPNAQPNKAHIALARMEQAGKLAGVITQNIDGLHQAAGSVRVYELHGSVRRNACDRCGKRFDGMEPILAAQDVPRCDVCGGIIKPDVVLYDEPLNEQVVNDAVHLIASADLLIVGGTSLTVYPAASYLQYARCPLVLINKTATPMDNRAALCIREPIGETLGALY